MSLQNLTTFFLMALLITLSPGPDILTVLTRSITQGTAAGLIATLGFATGLIFHTTLAATGLSLLLAQSPTTFRLIQILGACYLIHLALRRFLSKESLTLDPESDPSTQTASRAKIYRQSILMNVLNPKVTLFFLAFLSKFYDPHGTFPFWLQMTLLGTLFALATLLGFGTCALLAARLSTQLRQHPKAAQPLRYATALVFLLIATLLLFQ